MCELCKAKVQGAALEEVQAVLHGNCLCQGREAADSLIRLFQKKGDHFFKVVRPYFQFQFLHPRPINHNITCPDEPTRHPGGEYWRFRLKLGHHGLNSDGPERKILNFTDD